VPSTLCDGMSMLLPHKKMKLACLGLAKAN
jgi:hypothetical protein